MRRAVSIGILAGILAGLLAAGAALAAPFGLNRGDQPPSLSILRDNGDGTVVLSAVPRAYPGMSRFFARFDSVNGLCSIAGATAPFAADSQGHAARDYAARLAARLSRVYGTALRYDFSKSAGQAAPQRWVGELAAGERIYHVFWTAESGAALPEGLQGVALSIGAADAASPFVMLKFDFDNLSRCEEHQAQLEELGL